MVPRVGKTLKILCDENHDENDHRLLFVFILWSHDVFITVLIKERKGKSTPHEQLVIHLGAGSREREGSQWAP